jgi:hypothetical protein
MEFGITERGPQDIPSDPSKSVNTDSNSHDEWSFKEKWPVESTGENEADSIDAPGPCQAIPT